MAQKCKQISFNITLDYHRGRGVKGYEYEPSEKSERSIIFYSQMALMDVNGMRYRGAWSYIKECSLSKS